MRIGIGYDIHRLVPTVESSSIPVGGVSIPCFFRVEAHSDGDVLLHALVDACLGALALGDIGQWFSDKDPKYKGRSSREFVQAVMSKIHEMGWRVANVDSNILLQDPKMAPFTDEIRGEIAKMLGTERSAISVKAKTNEGLGAIGQRKAIAAQVVVSLELFL